MVDKSKVKVKIDNKEVNNILPSITSTKKLNIEYSFLDSQTGLVIKNIILEFVVRMSDFSSGKTKPHLIMIPAAQNYTLNYNPYINKIVEQINQLDLKSYKEIIACCLRSLFEISFGGNIQVHLYYKHVDTLCMYPHAYFYYNKRRIRLVRWDIAPVF